MRKYYTRPCNFYYGNYAKKLVKNKKAFFLAGNPNIAFDQIEIFQNMFKFSQKSVRKFTFLVIILLCNARVQRL